MWEALLTPRPQHYERVSIWVAPDGATVVRRTTRNFFTGKYETRDYPP